MPRPPEPEKRVELARRAIEVLRREGLEISISQLAKRLEVKRPTLLYHFPSRSHIVEAALEDLLSQQAAFVMAEIAKHEHPIDRLYAQLCAIHAYHHGNEAYAMFLAQAIATASPERMLAIIDIGSRVFAEQRALQAEGVRAGIASGRVAACDVDALMALVRAITDGLVVQRVMTQLDLEPVHELIWAQLLRPLKIIPTGTSS